VPEWAATCVVALVTITGAGLLKMLFDIKTSLATLTQIVVDNTQDISNLEQVVYRSRRNDRPRGR
jgi:hypothetical protein